MMRISFMPGLYVRRELMHDTALKLLQVQGRSVYRVIGMAWRKSTARHATFEKIARLCRDVVQAEFSDLSHAA